MTDYMSEASKAVYMCTTRGAMSEREAMMQTLAKHLEALDTANTRADAAEKREMELREAVRKAARKALAVFDANDLAEPGPRGLLNALIQPEPDPLPTPPHLKGVEPWPGGQASEVLADFRAAFQQEGDWWKPDPEDPYWMLEKTDGNWLKNAHSCLTTRDATKAIRYPSEWHADAARRSLHGTNHILFNPTEHKWCASIVKGESL